MKSYLLNVLQNILASLARKVIKKSHPDIIGITGSVGKSTTKEAIYQVLNSKFSGQIKRSSGNFNNEIGFPLVILGYKDNIRWWSWTWVLIVCFIKVVFSNPLKNTKIFVLEYAADKPGDIEYLTSIAKPKIAVITAIGFSHMKNFKNLDQVVEEKSKLVKVLPEDGYALLNQDDSDTEKIKSITKAKIIYFKNRFNPQNEIAIKIGEIYQIDNKDSKEALEKLPPLKGRLNIITGLNGSTIIDDTYNANPLSVEKALVTLSKFNGRKTAILGDMLELGSVSTAEHKRISEKTAEIADLFITVGQRFKNSKSDYWFSDPIQAGNFVLSKIRKGDIILVKGSQGMRMEKVVEKIILQKDIMSEILVRQEPAWKKKQFKQE